MENKLNTKIGKITYLTSRRWRLLDTKYFLGFTWSEKFYWSGVTPFIGPFSLKEALAIELFLGEQSKYNKHI